MITHDLFLIMKLMRKYYYYPAVIREKNAEEKKLDAIEQNLRLLFKANKEIANLKRKLSSYKMRLHTPKSLKKKRPNTKINKLVDGYKVTINVRRRLLYRVCRD